MGGPETASGLQGNGVLRLSWVPPSQVVGEQRLGAGSACRKHSPLNCHWRHLGSTPPHPGPLVLILGLESSCFCLKSHCLLVCGLYSHTQIRLPAPSFDNCVLLGKFFNFQVHCEDNMSQRTQHCLAQIKLIGNGSCYWGAFAWNTGKEALSWKPRPSGSEVRPAKSSGSGIKNSSPGLGLVAQAPSILGGQGGRMA